MFRFHKKLHLLFGMLQKGCHVLFADETIEPQCIDDVTMLFSDIVGFTSICSSCTPMDVINMLNSLYTKFDNCCGFLDVYKVR